MVTLSLKSIQAADKSSMFPKILEFPGQLRKGWEIAEWTQSSIKFKKIENIVFSGMGGSAIAGDVLKAVLGNALKVPMVVNRGYALPVFANKSTLFIASSYSGNTEETISATEQAVKKGCVIICVCSGGRIGEIARMNKFPMVTLPAGYPPRSALGFSLGVLLQMFDAFGVKSVSKSDLESASAFLQKESLIFTDLKRRDNPAVLFSKKLAGTLPLINASVDILDAVGFRWKCQFNENSKMHSFFLAMPEMNHNEIVAWKRLAANRTFFPALTAVLLRTLDEHPRIRLRMETTRELVEKNKGKVLDVFGKGSSFFEQMLYLIHLGDVISLYLAVLNGVDPTEIDNINYLKNKLSKNN
jgi:glucose/mannose-6-phosphate isomerase